MTERPKLSSKVSTRFFAPSSSAEINTTLRGSLTSGSDSKLDTVMLFSALTTRREFGIWSGFGPRSNQDAKKP